ncbi:hypothetical protein Ddye_021464 [Dipteronia dyeriana]|uniref:HAT C-terminal dimerisation domain-containing protein n=1 Tax=Dipteronia dyeriana TaxID=168575 RepID=A0AAD9U1P2_9ROSI|nr:hypothetical protein Ddye_021464 [Dipteronia dyeriana]
MSAISSTKGESSKLFYTLQFIRVGTPGILWIIASIFMNLRTTLGSEKGLHFIVSVFAWFRSSPTVAPFDDNFFSDETSCCFPPDQFQFRSSTTATPFGDHFFSNDTSCCLSLHQFQSDLHQLLLISTTTSFSTRPAAASLQISFISSQPEVNSNNVDNVVNVEESSNQIRYADQVTERKRKFRSTDWEHYDFGSVNGKEIAICKYCKHAYDVGSGKRAIGNDGSSCLTLAAQHFHYEVSRIDISRMILMHGYPLKMVEHERFKDYTRSLQPLFKPISRTTARRDIMSMYEIKRFFLLIYGEDKGLVEVKKVRNLCEEIFLEYQVKVGEKRYKEIKAICNSEFNHIDEMDSLDGFFPRNSESIDAIEKSELDCYLEEKTLPGSREFDVLSWWKLNGIKYPIMSEIARDILAIPISTVASESSFSTSGRIVSAQRNTIDGVGDIDVDDDNDNEVNEVADCSGATKALK